MALPRTYAELNQHIEAKERELQEYRERRIGQLESLVEERDQLLLEASKRFEKLRDDFEYNLTLIQARDIEIERLEHELGASRNESEDLHAEVKSLMQHLEAAKLREQDIQKKAELERVNHKRIFDELKDGIQEARWASEEESMAQAREIETLKADIRRLGAQKDEILESQRRDLTQTFESLLQQREESFAAKEREIGSQVSLLEARFEALQTENTRLKADIAACQRKRETLTEEAAGKEEARRQLQWALDDERAARAQADSAHAHALQQLTLEISMLKENAEGDVGELRRKLAQAKEEASREKEFRAALEQRAEELRRSAQQDLSTLENEIAEARALVGRQQLQVAALRDEKDDAEQRATGYKVECDGLELRLTTLVSDRDMAVEEARGLRERVKQAEADLARVQQEFQDYRCQTGNRESSALASVTQQLVEAHAAHLQEITELRRSHAEEVDRLSRQHEQTLQQRNAELSQRQDGDMMQVQRRLADRESELAVCREQVRELKEQLEDERKEAAALKLRFSVYEAQRPGVGTGGLSAAGQAAQRVAAGSAGPSDRAGGLQLPQQLPESPDVSMRGPTGAAFDNYLHSPMFSEDLGTIPSFPNSPLASMHRGPYGAHGGLRGSEDFGVASVDAYDHHYSGARDRVSALVQGRTQQHQGYREEREGFGAWGESKNAREGHSGGVDTQRTGTAPGPRISAEDRALAEENERLKQMIKEMRKEVEQLHEELEVNRSGVSSPGKPVDMVGTEEGLKVQGPAMGGRTDLQRTGDSSANSGLSMRGTASSMDVSDREKFGMLETRLQQTMEEVRRLRQERSSVMDAGNKLRSALAKHVLQAEEPPDEEAAAELLEEVDHVQDWLEAGAARSTRREAAPYKFSEEFDDYYGDRQYALQNSERYRREQRELALQQQQQRREQEELRRRQARGTQRSSGRGAGTNSAGLPTAMLLGEQDQDDYRHHQLSEPDDHHRQRSAGSRVWGSPGKAEGASRIPIASGSSRPGGGSGRSGKATGRPGDTAAVPPPPAPPAADHATDEALGFSAAAVQAASSGNLLLTVTGSSLPRTNSSRMTPSQVDALRRIQEAKRRNSIHVGVVPTANASQAHQQTQSGPAAVTIGTRKVANYAKWLEHPDSTT